MRFWTCIQEETRRRLLCFFLLIVGLHFPMFLFGGNAPAGLTYLGVACSVEFGVFLWSIMKINGRFLNFSTIFISVLFVFNFGQLIIYTYFRGIYSHVRFLNLFTASEALRGFKFINASYALICVGTLLGEAVWRNKTDSIKLHEKNKQYDWGKCIWAVVLLTFPVKLFIDACCVHVSFTQGGTVAREWLNNFPNVFLYFGKISLVGFALLLVRYKDKPWPQFALFAFLEVYILLMMLSGIRSENVAYMLVFGLIYLANFHKKIPVYGWLLCGVLGYAALSFIVAAGEFRLVTDKSIDSFLNILNKVTVKESVVFKILDHMGDTGYTAQCVINKWLVQYEPSYGKSYLLGSMAVLPNIPGITDAPGRLTAESCFALRLQEAGTLAPKYTNIGGSLIGELFFNFGLTGGIIASLFVGLLIGWISGNSSRWFEEKNYYGLMVAIPLMFATVYWVRDYYGGRIREVVWGPVFFWIILRLSTVIKAWIQRFWGKSICSVKR